MEEKVCLYCIHYHHDEIPDYPPTYQCLKYQFVLKSPWEKACEDYKPFMEDDCPHDEGYVNGYCKICREHWRGE